MEAKYFIHIKKVMKDWRCDSIAYRNLWNERRWEFPSNLKHYVILWFIESTAVLNGVPNGRRNWEANRMIKYYFDVCNNFINVGY